VEEEAPKKVYDKNDPNKPLPPKSEWEIHSGKKV
jgi:hypothetical protein